MSSVRRSDRKGEAEQHILSQDERMQESQSSLRLPLQRETLEQDGSIGKSLREVYVGDKEEARKAFVAAHGGSEAEKDFERWWASGELPGIEVPTKELHIGFTGTRRGMNEFQYNKVNDLLKRLARIYQSLRDERELIAHHGDCLGSDVQFHDLAADAGYYTHVHPPVNSRLRAYAPGTYTDQPKSYRIRNQDIVRCADLLIATPHRHEKDGASTYSGTWATVRIARQRNVPYVIFYADGRTEGGNKWKKLLK